MHLWHTTTWLALQKDVASQIGELDGQASVELTLVRPLLRLLTQSSPPVENRAMLELCYCPKTNKSFLPKVRVVEYRLLRRSLAFSRPRDHPKHLSTRTDQ